MSLEIFQSECNKMMYEFIITTDMHAFHFKFQAKG